MTKPDPETACLPDQPTTCIRLTRDQILWLLAGLRPVVCGYATAVKFGCLPWDDFFGVRPDLRPRQGRFHRDLMDVLLGLFPKLELWAADVNSKTHRLQCDGLQLSMLAFAARFASKQVRHGHVVFPDGRPPKLARASLLRKLERPRRRAARALKTQNPAAYAVFQNGWHQFQTWMRNEAAYCRCDQPAVFSARHRHLSYVDTCLKLATRIVHDEGFPSPGEKELRRLVRLALRYARRERMPATLKDLVCANPEGRFVLERFLSDRLHPKPGPDTNVPERI